MSESSPSYPSLLPECDLKNSSGALYLQCETIHPGKFLPDPEGQKAPETGKLCLDQECFLRQILINRGKYVKLINRSLK